MQEQLIPVMVPQSRLTAVYHLLGMEPSKEVSALTWTQEELQKVWNESDKPMRNFLTMIAGAPGEISSEMLMACRGTVNRRQLAGQLGAFGRRIKHRHAGKQLYQQRWDKTNDEYLYSMTPEIKEFFQKV